MKTNTLLSLIVIALITVTQPARGGPHGGGGGFRGGGFAGGHFGGGAHFYGGGGRFYGGGPRFSSGGRHFVAGGSRFSPSGMGSSSAFRSHAFAGNRGITSRTNVGSGTFNHRGNRFGTLGTASGVQSRRSDRQSFNGRNHVFARHDGNWHRDWDRGHDHWWHGHRSRFVDGSWLIFDDGFYPYDYSYPYDYYADDYYPYQYDRGVYEGDEDDYSNRGAYDSSERDADSTVDAAQAQLNRQGYYRGEIDGIFGAATQRAVMRYQNDHGLRVTGSLNVDTLHALALPRLGSN